MRGDGRYHVWRAGFGAAPAVFATMPEPRSLGSAAIGHLICEGQLSLGGLRIEAGTESLWHQPAPSPDFEADRHGFAWLDDLAAAGTRRAAEIARGAVAGWLVRHGQGGPGWQPELAARRVVRWINHAEWLMAGFEPGVRTAFLKSLTRHLAYLGRRWRKAPPGLGQLEALTGMMQAAAALEGAGPRLREAQRALDYLCGSQIDAAGGIAGRSPADLLDVFAMLVWTETALLDLGLMAGAEHAAAIGRIAPVLRALRQADGALARFHGGGRGPEGRLDAMLAASRVRKAPGPGLAMGFARLARGRATVITDAALPPEAGAHAHASVAAFEMTVGRRPMVVNCGDGAAFGAEWDRAARRTPAHSGLSVDTQPLTARRGTREGPALAHPPARVDWRPEPGQAGMVISHDGYRAAFGLTAYRRLELEPEGAALTGEDILRAEGEEDRARLAQMVTGRGGVAFSLRFHLHPDVTARMTEARDGITLVLKSGEVWEFRSAPPARISLDPSVYLEKTRPQPTPTRQIVLQSVAVDDITAIRWSFRRIQTGRSAIRDLFRDEQSLT